MELAEETIVRLSGERARRLNQLAARRGVTEEALVTEALDRLFNESVLSPDDVDSDDVDDVEMLRRIEAELGPLPPIRTMPLINPGDIVSVIPVPVRSELLRRMVRHAEAP